MNETYKTKLADQVHDSFFDMDFIIPKKFEEEIQKIEIKEPERDEKEMHVGKNNILIPSLNLPNKNENVKVLIEEEQVEQFHLPEEPTRESIIQDLKNTIIQLPQKFKMKKGNSDEQKSGELKK